MKLTLKQRQHLSQLEDMAHAWAEQACNEEVSDSLYEMRKEEITKRIRHILGYVPTGFFWNTDPRGYALKIDNEATKIPDGMVRDWGGYGILAHEDTLVCVK